VQENTPYVLWRRTPGAPKSPDNSANPQSERYRIEQRLIATPCSPSPPPAACSGPWLPPMRSGWRCAAVTWVPALPPCRRIYADVARLAPPVRAPCPHEGASPRPRASHLLNLDEITGNSSQIAVCAISLLSLKFR